MTDAKSAGDQCDALITLSVAYQGARDITQEMLRIAFGNHFHATAIPVWPQPFLSVQQKREKTKALDRFLNQSKDVIRKVLRETNYAIDELVASGTDVSPTWLVADPLNGFLGALPIAEIVQVAVVQDAEFESAIQSISKELVVANRKVNSEKNHKTVSSCVGWHPTIEKWVSEMTDAEWVAGDQSEIDWEAIRGAALNCLNATWSMMGFANRSQTSEYDAQTAVAQLDDIDRARATFRQAMETLEPGFECSSDPSFRDSRVFKALQVAISHQSAYPEFRFGPVCCATAHEAAFELLRWAILWIENGLNDELDERGSPDHHVASIDDLHKLTPEELRVTLSKLERRQTIQTFIQLKETKQIRAWIDREWAAVSTNSRMKVIVLKSADIRDRYHLTPKQIRDWAKDQRKPFITRVAGQRKYEINPDHPELVALMK